MGIISNKGKILLIASVNYVTNKANS